MATIVSKKIRYSESRCAFAHAPPNARHSEISNKKACEGSNAASHAHESNVQGRSN